MLPLLKQAATASYIAHLFASSLMSRWLLHYSPSAVIVRLCTLSVLLSYACVLSFQFTHATATAPRQSGTIHECEIHLDRALSVWIAISIAMMLLYFSTQQDISVEEDRDNKTRRQILRAKCLTAVAWSSLLSLMFVLIVIHLGERDWDTLVTRDVLKDVCPDLLSKAYSVVRNVRWWVESWR